MEIATQLTFEDFQQMYALEKLYYEEKWITPVEESWQWYSNRPHSYVVIKEEDKIIGFMCMFPVAQCVYEAIEEGVYNDKYLTYQNILTKKECKQTTQPVLFLSCVVVHPAFRKTNAIYKMLACYCKEYEQWQEDDILFKRILTDNVTEDGVRFSKKLGFQEVCSSDHESVIYAGEFPFAYTQFRRDSDS
ncbi:MAG: GNAT family N-acetyltransferase [Bacilli bacterium]